MTHVMDRRLVVAWWQKPRGRVVVMAGCGAALLVSGAMALRGLSERSLRVAAADVSVTSVTRATFHDFVPLHGTVVPRDTIYLDALAGGQVASLLVQAGDEVTQGQPLIVFHNAQLELDVLNNAGRLVESITQVQTFETQLESNRIANANALESIRFNITSLQHTASRYDPLLKAGAIAPKDAETIHDQLNHYRALLPLQSDTNRRQESLRLAELPHLKAEEDSLRKSLDATHAQLNDLTVRAPVTGKITQLDLKVGENRNRGERLAEITPRTGFKISADVDEYYLSRVHVGQTATVTVNDRTFPLKVARVYPSVKGGTFPVDLAFDGPMPMDLSPGAAADGKLSLGGDHRALIVAAGPFLEASGGDYVFLLDSGGHSAHRKRVKIGRRNAEQAEVLQGLKSGDRIITSDYANYEHLDRVDIH